MNDILGKVFSILLCAWLMFLYPLNAAKEENRQIERMYLYQETVRFLDNVCNTGMISDRDMQNYLGKISRMNALYQTVITHESLIDEKEDEANNREIFQIYTQTEIFEQLEKEQEYRLDYNDFIKIVISNPEGNIVVCYGGSIKAVYLPKEESE